MVSPNERFFRGGLTGLRAAAALWVTAFHLNALVGPKVFSLDLFGFVLHFHPLVTIGWVGANVFFVLSGFLLTTHLLEVLRASWPQASFGPYFIARIRRVFPAYWFQLAILFVAALVAARALPEWTDTIPIHLPMLHNLSERASSAINPVYWTLPIEFSFYLCLPMIARWLVRAEVAGGAARWRTLAAVVIGALAVSWTYRVIVFDLYRGDAVNTIVWALSQLPGSIDQFVIGAAAAAAWRWARQDQRPWAADARTGSVLLVLGLGLLIAWMYFIDSIYAVYWAGHWAVYVWYSVAALFIALVLVAIAIGGALPRLLFENRVALFLGTISYSLYLWHFPIAVALTRVVDAPALGFLEFSLVAMPVIVVASAISYYAFERPFLRKRAPQKA